MVTILIQFYCFKPLVLCPISPVGSDQCLEISGAGGKGMRPDSSVVRGNRIRGNGHKLKHSTAFEGHTALLGRSMSGSWEWIHPAPLCT